MTTIIVDTKRRKIYSDSQGTVDNQHQIVKKIHSIRKNKIIVSGCGLLSDIHKVLALAKKAKTYDGLLEDLKDINISKNSEILLIFPNHDGGEYYCIKRNPNSAWWKPSSKNIIIFKLSEVSMMWRNGYIVIGSGSAYAHVALVATNNPEASIRITSKIDIHTDSNVQCFDFSNVEHKEF